MNSESENSIYNYNMIFNKVNNVNSDEDIDLNTNIISDINLQNFDMKRYEYYTNLIYIYKKDPDTLYNLLNKYYNIKNFKKKEKNIIKYISNYARLLKGKTSNIEGPSNKDGSSDKNGLGKESTDETIAETIQRGVYGGNPYAKLISTLKDNVVDNSIHENDNKSYLVPGKKYEEDKEPTLLKQPIEDKEDTVKLEKILKMLNKTLIDIEKQEKLFDTEKETETSNILNKTVKLTVDIVNNLLAYINNDDSSAKTKSVLNKTVKPAIDIVNKVVGSIKKDSKEDTTKTANILNKTVKPAIEVIKKLLANINASRGISPPIPGIQSNIVFGNTNVATENAPMQPNAQPPMQPNAQPSMQPNAQLPMQPSAQPLIGTINGKFGGPMGQLRVNTNQLPKVLKISRTNATVQPTAQFSGLPNIQPSSLQRMLPLGSSPSVKQLAKKFNNMQTTNTLPVYRTVGGNPDEDLKIKYLDTQKYEKLSDKELKELKKFNRLLVEDDDNKIGQLSIDIDNYYANNDKDEKDDIKKEKYDKDIIQKIKNFENDPKNPLEELALTFDDRIVFIIATFFIRYITIIMVQWCIDINIIKTFYEGFIYYAVIYIIIFWFIVLFINIDNSFDVKYMNFNGIINSIRTLFYYFYMGTNGISRLLIHTSLIMILIIIPIILNIKKKEDYKDDEQIEIIKILNYDERKQLSKSLSLFTMFIWLFTSIIATKF